MSRTCFTKTKHMDKSRKILADFLTSFFASARRGTKAEFVRKTEFSSSQVENYCNGVTAPTLDQLDRAAEALGRAPWELIKPEGAEATHARKVAEATEELEKIRLALVPSALKPASAARASLNGLLDEIRDESELRAIERYVRARQAGKDRTKPPLKKPNPTG